MCLFVGCRIGDIPVWRLVRAAAPFLVAEVAVVILLGVLAGPLIRTASAFPSSQSARWLSVLDASLPIVLQIAAATLE